VFAFRDSLGAVEVAFTDRHGGVSEGPWSSLNLGTSNGDDPARVRTNFGILARGLGVRTDRIARMNQVHGSDALVLPDVPADIPVADALVTTTPGLTLLARAADCVPLVLADPRSGVVGVAHVGRQGLVVGIVAATVAAMRRAGARAVTAWIGPRICGRCYEVPDVLRAEVAAVVPQSASTTARGTPGLDIGAGVAAQLHAAGVDVVDVAAHIEACTYENADLFSYRRQGKDSGRFAGTVRLRP